MALFVKHLLVIDLSGYGSGHVLRVGRGAELLGEARTHGPYYMHHFFHHALHALKRCFVRAALGINGTQELLERACLVSSLGDAVSELRRAALAHIYKYADTYIVLRGHIYKSMRTRK